MPTNVPKPTFTDKGFVAPAESAVLAGVIADFQAAFGGKLNLSLANPSSLSTPQGQLASSEAAVIGDANDTFLFQSTQTDPAFAQGRWQDAIGRIYFIERIGAQPTVIQVACSGLTGVVIPVNAQIQDTAGNTYTCQEAGTIPSGGSVTLPFGNLAPGPIAVPNADDVSIFSAIPGWDSVTVVSGVLGNDTESRSAFETRRAATVAKNSLGAIGSIIGLVSEVLGVTDYWGYDNGISSPATVQGVTVAAHSIFVSVEGGANLDVAQAILEKKAPGCDMTGNTVVTAFDSNPLYSAPIAYQITFERPAPLQILFAVNIVSSPLVPADAATQIQNAIINAFAGGDGGPRARIGSIILATRFIAPVAALGIWAQVRTLLLGSNNTEGAVFTGTIAAGTLTVGTLVSGTIAIGQTISDVNGDITLGTTIISGSGSSWVVSPTQTVAGASFTGNGSGTNLTASSVTGVIEPGNAITGTGVPGSTVIVSQTSGTPGGAGVYVTNNATTSSGAAITARKTITAAVADQNTVTVDADQIPEIVAADIAVTVS